MTVREKWGLAFVRQARSDWRVYQLLSEASVPACHVLHYLQMACEKVAKAYRIRDLSSPIDELTRHHVGFTRFVSAFLRSPMMCRAFENQTARHRTLMQEMNQLARLIEGLAPAVDREARPENSEYPWVAGDDVIAPCDYGYPNFSLLTEPRGRGLLKLIGRMMDDFEQGQIH